MMTSAQIRQSFLEFFKSRQHAIVPSSSLLPDSPNLLFTNAGMNQFVPIFLGEKKCPYSPGRAADTQKCIRAGGKHNDLEDVGLDTYHHTFFEMLGNWSFGDYFKKEAIEWAWELITKVWNFPPARLYATVYSPDKEKGDPADFDQEAHDVWAEKFRAAGLDPAVHIVNGNKKDNFWMMGETGPCGPCTELHVDLTPDGGTRGALVNKGSPQCIEIWNLVFIQFNANPDGTFSPLPACHVDTGMGFERVTAIKQCTDDFQCFTRVISNYETDIFRPIFAKLAELSGKKYMSTLPGQASPEAQGATGQERVDIAFRVIADHARTLSFAIADGILPGNTDRNYVLRRILRRAVRYGRALGFREPFFHKLVPVLAESMGDTFPEIRARQAHVQDVIRAEEDAFNRTLDRGIELFENEVARLGAARQLSGDFAFKLYDTYGFPLDLTQLLARERGLSVDDDAFGRLMSEQRLRAKAAQKREVITLATHDAATHTATVFTGYDATAAATPVSASIVDDIQLKNGSRALILDRTPFYAEMGGQAGDSGFATLPDGTILPISGTRRSGETFLHILNVDEKSTSIPPLARGQTLTLTLDHPRRLAISRHHTATHLLHWALRQVAGADIAQKGSSVDPDRLTFDFNASPLTPSQIREAEALVNARVLENAPVSTTVVPHADVRHRADIMQFFGDKYGDAVRVVQIGGTPSALDGYSMELCGGTHVRATGEVGLFRILSESAIAAGTRRVEAVAGIPAAAAARADFDQLRALAGTLAVGTPELAQKLTALLGQLSAQEKQLRAHRQRALSDTALRLASTAAPISEGLRRVVANLAAGGDEAVLLATPADLRDLANETIRHADVVLLGAVISGKASLVCQCAPAAIKAGMKAGEIIATLCKKLDGKGGGKPDFAMGGGSADALAPVLAGFADAAG
ncbi:MAG: alanine--tRNA ligase [Puniceicoccales bacterium]|jgi:alanyl-tRNA synthetase|nr:alanine--tRNA ligase [Puniceicoccales bacterium]